MKCLYEMSGKENVDVCSILYFSQKKQNKQWSNKSLEFPMEVVKQGGSFIGIVSAHIKLRAKLILTQINEKICFENCNWWNEKGQESYGGS